MHAPLSLTIPAVIDMRAGTSGWITITNTGTGRITITDSVGHLSARAATYPAELTIGPAHPLKAGQSERLRITAPAGHPGVTYGNLVFTARLAATAGTIHIHGGAASSVKVTAPGVAVAAHAAAQPQTVTPAHPGGSDALAAAGLGAGGLLVLTACALAALGVRRSHRRTGRRSHRSPA